MGGSREYTRKEKPSAVIYGLPTRTIAQLRLLVGESRLQTTLAQTYDRIDVGEFTVWLRRPYT